VKLATLIILVVSADGYVDTHLSERPVRQGNKVHAFILYYPFDSWIRLVNCAVVNT